VHSFYLDAAADPDQARFLLHEAAPVASFPVPLNVEAGTSVLLDNGSSFATTYLWDFGDGSTDSDPQPTHTWASPGVYTVTLTAYNGTCTDVHTQNLTVSGTVLPLTAKVFLQGPYDSALGLMADNIRTLPDFPLTEPYTALGYPNGVGGASIAPALLNITGNDAIVDWVIVELRDQTDPTSVVAALSGLVQRDGDVVHTDGVSPLPFEMPVGQYHVALHHRNHLGVMTINPIQLGTTPTDVNFTSVSLATYGTDAQVDINGVRAMWSGDVTFDGTINYTGSSNDRDAMLLSIGGSVPTNVVGGYSQADVNMDGSTKYVGTENDRDPILINIGGSVPTNIRLEQLP
jgi:PKD repeat protein